MHLSEHISIQFLHGFCASSACGLFSYIFPVNFSMFSFIFFLFISFIIFLYFASSQRLQNVCRQFFLNSFALFNSLIYPYISLFLFPFHIVACLQIARIYRAVQFCKRYFQIYEKQRKSYQYVNLFIINLLVKNTFHYFFYYLTFQFNNLVK